MALDTVSSVLYTYVCVCVYRTPETNFNGAEAFSLHVWKDELFCRYVVVGLMDGLKSVCVEFFPVRCACVHAYFREVEEQGGGGGGGGGSSKTKYGWL